MNGFGVTNPGFPLVIHH
ncbi:MAG: hypothetical protein K0S80_2047, partial [Neobacillus sp.]|nr:hypothetical protein [Neobacillus sp.]